MSTETRVGRKRKVAFKQTEAPVNEYQTGTESLSIEDKMKLLDEMGRPELIDVFKGWTPRQRKRRTTAPLDQRVAVTVTTPEKFQLEKELKDIKASGSSVTTSQFIRNRALGSVDIHGWSDKAKEALDKLEELNDSQPEMRKRKRQLIILLEDSDDEEDISMYEKELNNLNLDFAKLLARNEKRVNRLSGRMSMAESETIKWKAQRLCISSSDYLRMMIFSLYPNSTADAHMSLDAKRRFYLSIMEVAQNGWGKPPNVYECSQCGNYIEEIAKQRDRIKQLETFT